MYRNRYIDCYFDRYFAILCSGIVQFVELATLMRKFKFSRSMPGWGRIKKIFDFLLKIFLSFINSSAHRTWFDDDPYMVEPQANYVKSLDFRCELASKERTKTGNEPLMYWYFDHLRYYSKDFDFVPVTLTCGFFFLFFYKNF